MRTDRILTVASVLDPALEEAEGRTALITPSASLTYRELDDSANAAAALLADHGVRAGDRVAVCLPNDVDIVVSFHATMRLGAIWVGVNRPLAAPEKAELLRLADPAVVIHDDRADLPDTGHGVSVATDDPRSGWSAALGEHGHTRPPTPDGHAPAGIAFTSGTTGAPKGIVHSQRNLLLPAKAIVASRGYGTDLRKGDCLPLTILNMQVLTTTLTSVARGCCILTDRRDARGVAEWIAAHAVTVWNGVPTILYGMTADEEIEPALLRTLEDVWIGGAASSESLYRGFAERFGVPVRQTYGLTEAPTVVAIEPMGAPHIAGGSGRVLPHLHVTIHDDAGAEVGTGELGEVHIASSGVEVGGQTYTPMVGYWREGAVEPFTEPTLATGDIGCLDDAGNLFIRDRLKLLIIRGGANIYPAEVERVIEAIDGISTAVVLGVPDERLGQRVVAVVERTSSATLTEADVIEHCAANLARYKVPEAVHIVTDLPRNSMGKVIRPDVSAWLADHAADAP